MYASTTRQRKIDRSSYRRPTQFGCGLLPPEPPTASLPPIRPSEIAAQISQGLARVKELGRRIYALQASLRNPLPPIRGGSPEANRRAAWERQVAPIYAGIDDTAGR